MDIVSHMRLNNTDDKIDSLSELVNKIRKEQAKIMDMLNEIKKQIKDQRERELNKARREGM